jgi:acetyltransferase EpsM
MSQIILIGGGQLSRVIIEAARAQGFAVIGFVDPEPCDETKDRLGLDRLGTDADLPLFPNAKLVLGIGGNFVSSVRERIVDEIGAAPGRWATVIHPHASVSPTARIAEGVVVLAGVVICSGAKISRHCLINLGATIDHDVDIGGFVHVGSQAVLGGGVVVAKNSNVGMGAIVRDHIHVTERTTIGMGAVVTKQFPPGSILVGVPAKAVPPASR